MNSLHVALNTVSEQHKLLRENYVDRPSFYEDNCKAGGKEKRQRYTTRLQGTRNKIIVIKKEGIGSKCFDKTPDWQNERKH